MRGTSKNCTITDQKTAWTRHLEAGLLHVHLMHHPFNLSGVAVACPATTDAFYICQECINHSEQSQQRGLDEELPSPG